MTTKITDVFRQQKPFAQQAGSSSRGQRKEQNEQQRQASGAAAAAAADDDFSDRELLLAWRACVCCTAESTSLLRHALDKPLGTTHTRAPQLLQLLTTERCMLLACVAPLPPPRAADLAPEERLLRQFDLDSKYGPCTGMTRMERCAAVCVCVCGVTLAHVHVHWPDACALVPQRR
jgi:hypothetical protein